MIIYDVMLRIRHTDHVLCSNSATVDKKAIESTLCKLADRLMSHLRMSDPNLATALKAFFPDSSSVIDSSSAIDSSPAELGRHCQVMSKCPFSALGPDQQICNRSVDTASKPRFICYHIQSLDSY